MNLVDFDDTIAIAVREGCSFYTIDCFTGLQQWIDDFRDYSYITHPYWVSNDTGRLYLSNLGDIILTPSDITLYCIRCINISQQSVEFCTLRNLEPLPKRFYVPFNS